MKHRIFITTLLVLLSLTALYGATRDGSAKVDAKKGDLVAMLGTPNVDSTFDGVRVKVWLMTQKRHAELMKGKMSQMMMKEEKAGSMEKMERQGMTDSGKAMGGDMKGTRHDGMGMRPSMMDSMKAGTHHIMVDVSDVATGNDVPNARAQVSTVSPSMKNATKELTAMKHHFAGALTLGEPGSYRFSLEITAGGVSRVTHFTYAVK